MSRWTGDQQPDQKPAGPLDATSLSAFPADHGPSDASPSLVPDPGPGISLSGWIDKILASIGQQPNPIVPRQTVVGRALIFVTAIMCFLACLSLGTAWAVNKAARNWTIDASREVTVQIKPADGVDQNNQVSEALRIINATPGIVSARAYSDEEMAAILQPWLGSGLNLNELPVPRLIAIVLDPVVPADLAALARKLEQGVQGAALDDHRVWQSQVRSVARWIQLIAFLVLVLMLGATNAIIVFATRGAMAGNRDIVEVLHLVGARQHFIAGQFERHFLMLGFKGGMIGGTAAALVFLLARVVSVRVLAPAGEGALVQALSVGWEGYAGIAGIVAVLSILSALTSRLTVYRYLKAIY